MKWDVFHFLFKIRIFFWKIKNKTRQSKTTRRASTFSVFFKWFTMTWNVIGDAIVQNADRFKNPFVLVAAGDCPAKHGDVYNRWKKIKIKWKLTVKLQDDFMFFRLAKMNQHEKLEPPSLKKEALGAIFSVPTKRKPIFKRLWRQWKRLREKERERVVVIISKPGGEDGTMQHTRQTRMEWTYVFDDQLSFIRNRRDGVGSTLSCVRKKKKGGEGYIFHFSWLCGNVTRRMSFCISPCKKKKRKGKRERERGMGCLSWAALFSGAGY